MTSQILPVAEGHPVGVSVTPVDPVDSYDNNNFVQLASPTPIAQEAVPVQEYNNEGVVNAFNNTVTPLNEEQIQALCNQGFTRGLALSLNSTKECFAMRYWIVDNSSSMRINDGQRIISTNNRKQTVSSIGCSRWEEVVECVSYHVQMAALLDVPTKFRLLNHPSAHVGFQQFSIACSDNYETKDKQVHNALSVMEKTRPGGVTPLTDHILEIYYEIKAMVSALHSSGRRVVVIIATDGLPTDERGICNSSTKSEFVQALKRLEELPVWVVIRLSTDEDDIVQFYDDLDQQIELDLDLLDDFTAEAKEVVSFNPWMNYALPLHRLREMGYQQRVMDLIDERRLTKSELRDYCCLLFGNTGRVNDRKLDLADPSLDWKQFLKDVDRIQRQQQQQIQYDPVEKRNLPWVNIKKLDRTYGSSNKLKRIMSKRGSSNKWFKY